MAESTNSTGTWENDPENNKARFFRYLHFASSLILDYPGKEPFHIYLKKYFSAHRKHGSRDRKLIAGLCYGYFRLGTGVQVPIPLEERLLLGLFLTTTGSNPILANLKPDWYEKRHLPVEEKLDMVRDLVQPETIFPFVDQVSKQIDKPAFQKSFFIQPDLFLRIRPGKKEYVLQVLSDAGIDFSLIGSDCVSLSNTENITGLLQADEDIVIQDLSSQRVAESFYKMQPLASGHAFSVWDCCAGSGGKSILLFDHAPEARLTVSDSRKEIIRNLEGRFEKAGIGEYVAFVADLTRNTALAQDHLFDVILADVPCTGSGTWGRTPEQMASISIADIRGYASRQKSIITNAIPHLKAGGYLLYITCSVFEEENERVVSFIQKSCMLNLVQMKYLKGYKRKADTLFVALFQKKKGQSIAS